jgi:hypothetical protein
VLDAISRKKREEFNGKYRTADRPLIDSLADIFRRRVCCYSFWVNYKRLKRLALKTLIAIVAALLVISLLAHRIFHPR